MLLALRFEPRQVLSQRQSGNLPLRKNLLGSKRKANNIYFVLYYKIFNFRRFLKLVMVFMECRGLAV